MIKESKNIGMRLCWQKICNTIFYNFGELCQNELFNISFYEIVTI